MRCDSLEGNLSVTLLQPGSPLASEGGRCFPLETHRDGDSVLPHTFLPSSLPTTNYCLLSEGVTISRSGASSFAGASLPQADWACFHVTFSHKTSECGLLSTCCQRCPLLCDPQCPASMLRQKYVFKLLSSSVTERSAGSLPRGSVALKPLYYCCFCWVDTYIHSVLS